MTTDMIQKKHYYAITIDISAMIVAAKAIKTIG